MAIYHYNGSPIIDRVEIKTPRPGITYATITAAKDANTEQLEKLRTQLGAEDFSTLMDTSGNQAAIQVRGLKDGKSLLAALHKLGLAQCEIVTEATANDAKQISFRDRVRGKALFLSSIFYDLGNAAFIVSGIQRGKHNPDGKLTIHDKSEMMIGAAFSVGDVLMTMHGASRGDEELTAAAMGLKRHLHRKGIKVPEGNELNPDSLHQSGTFKATHRWLHSHVVQIKCLSELAGGLFTMHAALKPGNRNQGKLVAGLLISTGWLATLLLDKPRGHHIFDGEETTDPTMLQAMANNPRGLIARPLAIGNNISNLWGSLNPVDGERTRFSNEVGEAQNRLQQNSSPENMARLAYAQNKQHDYMWNVISACSFMIAHTLFGISGAKRPTDTEDDKNVMEDMVLLSANVLAKQPAEVRQTAIADTAEYVSKLTHVHLSKEQIEDAIRTKVDSLSQSTWVAKLQTPSIPSQVTI